MSLYTGCDEGTLEAFGDDNCLESFGQTQRVIFQKPFLAGARNFIELDDQAVGYTDPKLLASWQALKALDTDGKIVVSPTFGDPTMPDPEPRTFGNGNQVPDGAGIVLGDNTASFTARFWAKRAQLIANMQKLPGTIGVYLVDHIGRIAGHVDDLTTPTKLYPFIVTNLFVGSKKLGGLEEPDSNVLQFTFGANWSKRR